MVYTYERGISSDGSSIGVHGETFFPGSVLTCSLAQPNASKQITQKVMIAETVRSAFLDTDKSSISKLSY
jgi:hypothetical protein